MRLFKLKLKKLFFNIKKNSGKNNSGKIVIKNRGGGLKRKCRFIDYKRFLYLSAIVLKYDYFYKNNATIALILYKNGVLSYIIAYSNGNEGDILNNFSNSLLLQNGSNVLFKNISAGTILYNIEIVPGAGAQIARAAGAFVQVLGLYKKKKKFILIRLKSKKEYIIDLMCMGVLGIADSRYITRLKPLKKAGQSRNLGRRPHVRGVAMNPVDHPHGGNTSGGRCSVSIYGVLAKGYKTKKKFSKIKYRNQAFYNFTKKKL